jgi:hypothetical protein
VGGGDCNPTKPSLRNKKADTIYFSWSERWERVFLDWHCVSLPPDSFCSVAVEGSNSAGCEFHHSQTTASHVFIYTVQKRGAKREYLQESKAQEVSRRISMSVARVLSQVRSCRNCGGRSGTETGLIFFRVLRFPLPILISCIN